RLRGLTPRQRRLCRRQPELVAPLLEGVRLGTADCQHRFRHGRWNCHALGQHLDFGHVQVKGTPEAAVMYALQSGAATHAVYAACRSGRLVGCECRPLPRDTRSADVWKWAGCRAGLLFSGRRARRFLNARETEHDARSLMNRHNNRVGVKAVTRGSRRRCRCYGPSGTCSLRTCWLDAPTAFRSQLVELAPSGRALQLVGSSAAPDRSQLVHLVPSPSYCEPDAESGYNGTAGRQCRKQRALPGNCEYLCCGRGYNTRITHRRYCCNFHTSAAEPTTCQQRTTVRTCQ
ncbi:protein Wnt-7b-like, partial [Pollicipes pollicipes]|uniref:protein Wnt-7b-like n=1 Tax=Pollicipes pollicipes TaxID=41117 RepID=UPI0018851218